MWAVATSAHAGAALARRTTRLSLSPIHSWHSQMTVLWLGIEYKRILKNILFAFRLLSLSLSLSLSFTH